MIDRPETVLEMARRHVREGEARLTRQIAIVAQLERDNHTEAALATKVLETIRLFSLALRGGRNAKRLTLITETSRAPLYGLDIVGG